jgi:hypothetical protein
MTFKANRCAMLQRTGFGNDRLPYGRGSDLELTGSLTVAVRKEARFRAGETGGASQ